MTRQVHITVMRQSRAISIHRMNRMNTCPLKTAAWEGGKRGKRKNRTGFWMVGQAPGMKDEAQPQG